jgi:hypothetical protein
MLVAKNNSFVIRMKRFAAILFLTFVLIELMAVTPAGAWFRVEALPVHDSVAFRVKKDEGKAVRGRMSHSAYPVVVDVVGNAVKVDSPENQVLPIYTHSGTFYLIVRLNKGTNWLNGLPKGKYFVNSRLLTIK